MIYLTAISHTLHVNYFREAIVDTSSFQNKSYVIQLNMKHYSNITTILLLRSHKSAAEWMIQCVCI